ncbi:AMP-binding protein [Paenibacillus xylaniclasticus]|uniref:AMP-binding protein n=1 Tax=Paenibacillus xylaniclasticus TaxID=588083 RepID=UPI00175DF23C|nr:MULTISPECIES: AMP-binding protein [Paenibacillus]GFN32192.1 hypothetical protein PCURB6_24520 [Paenibacillus curdlanolyticus]
MKDAPSSLTKEMPIQAQDCALYSLTRNRKGNEYSGSRFQTPPRPERFKRYEGTYQRLKTRLLTEGQWNETDAVDLQLVERILMMAYGITSVKFYGYQSEMVWTVPSAGACYPFEVYLVIRHVEGMRPGVYYYSATSASLFYISGNENLYLLDQSLLPEDRNADFYIVSTIIPWRSCWKYSNRGYRFTYIDTGHLLCNFQTVMKALKLSSTTYTQLRTDYLRSLLHTDESEEAVSIICVTREGAGQAAGHERAYKQEQISYCRHLREPDDNEASFDWSAIHQIRQQMNEDAGEPDANWIHPFRMRKPWEEADKLSSLLFQRRSCSAFLRTSISEGQFNSIASIIYDYEDAITCYAVVHGVEHLEPGLYQLNGRSMVLLRQGDFRQQSTELCLDQAFVYDSAILLFYAVNLDSIRTQPAWTMRQRLIDAGNLSQLLYLKCEEIGLGYSAIGGYYDTEARELFGADENIEFVYAGVLGKEDRNANFQIKLDRYYLNKPKHKEGSSIPKGGVQLILDRMEESASKYSDHTAIVYDGVSYTYQEMMEQIEVYGQQAAAAITNRYPVGICMKNHPNYLFVYYGLLQQGFIPMLIDATLTQEEIKVIRESYHLGSLITMDSKGVVRYELYEDEHPDYDPDEFIDVAVCRFSSGTTGKPKCLMFTAEAIMNAAANWAAATGMTAEDKVLCTALFHNGLAFNTSLLSVFMSGACLIIHKNISPKSIWELVTRHNASVLVAFPVVFDMLNKSHYLNHDHPLRLCVSSSAPLHYNIKQSFEEQTGIKICDYYGIVEAGPATFNDGTAPDSLGKPIDGVHIRIVDEDGREVAGDEVGTLQIKTASMAKGYYNYPSSYASMVTPDGYYQTTDRGFIRNGCLYVVGRNSDMINVAGKKLDPTEVENSILSIEGVEEVAVIGVSNQSLTSEYPVAFVVCTPEVTPTAIIHHCQERLAPYKHPQKVILIPSIPRSGVGKVKRRELVDLYYSIHSEQERV